MSILDIKNKCRKSSYVKTALIYLAVSVFTIAVDNIYALFGHGVRSAAMSWMFLYPLIGGSVFYLFIRLLAPRVICFAGYRLFYNIYNSGIAVLTTGSLLQGVMEIAGTSSPYLAAYYFVGWLFTAIGFIFLLILSVNIKKGQD